MAVHQWGRLLVGLVVFFPGSAFADKPHALACGTYDGRLQEEAFFHGLKAGAPGLRSAARAASVDRGNVVLMEDTGGAIQRQNPFNLSQQVLRLERDGAAYRVDTTNGAPFDGSQPSTRLALDDDGSVPITLPFSFPFFENSYTTVWVNANGTLTFGAGDADYSGSLGHLMAGPPAIAAMFTDLDPSVSSGGVRVRQESGRVVVTWDQVPLAGYGPDAAQQSFQVRLYDGGRIELAYGLSTPPAAVVGISAGAMRVVQLRQFLVPGNNSYPNGVAEVFSSVNRVDVIAASQRFYESHDDAYDFLVFFTAETLDSPLGDVAFTVPVRSKVSGNGRIPLDVGTQFGSESRLQAVASMGSLSRYPVNPSGTIDALQPKPDTPLTLLAHQVGHMFLASVSIVDPTNTASIFPMLTPDHLHWSFNFDSEASVMGGNRIADLGSGVQPQFRTTGAVEGYSRLDQYLMGLRYPVEVPDSFVILNANQDASRPSQPGVTIRGTRRNVTIQELIDTNGARHPSVEVSQREFRMAFIVVVPAGADTGVGGPYADAASQADAYRSAFEGFFAAATENIASVKTDLLLESKFSLAPNQGLIVGQTQQATIEIVQPLTYPLQYQLVPLLGHIAAPASVTIPAGQLRVEFSISGVSEGVEEFFIHPSDAQHESRWARVQVARTDNLQLSVIGDNVLAKPPAGQAVSTPVVVQVTDDNGLEYAGVQIVASTDAGGTVQPANTVTDAKGQASLLWTPAPGDQGTLMLSVAGYPNLATTVKALGKPVVTSGGLVNAASFQGRVAPGMLASIFGKNLAAGIRAQAVFLPFPTDLGGVTVSINGVAAPVFYVSDELINFQVPYDAVSGKVVVQTRLGIGDPYDFTMDTVSPGIFFDTSTGEGSVITLQGKITSLDAVHAGEFLEVFATGLGGVDLADALHPTSHVVTAEIAGVAATVVYSGEVTPSGFNQVNVRVPMGVAAGRQPLILHVDGQASNTVYVYVAEQVP